MIDTPDALHALADDALTREAVALDTEFVWERTYYPRLGVVQVGFSDDEVHLVDAASLDDLSPLGDLLAAPHVTKILHDAQQDLTILYRATGALPVAVFDTQRAAGFAGFRSTISLAGLVRALLDVNLPKTESRTDWLRRPLSKAQRAYALDDVRHLHATRDALLRRVEGTEKADWLAEEMAAYDDPVLYEERDPHDQFERVKGSGRLRPRERAILRELAAWREYEARRRDLPKSHVLDDGVLTDLARRQPRATDDLKPGHKFSGRDIRRHGDALVEAVTRGLAVPKEAWPTLPPRIDDEDALDARLNLALALLKGKSLAHDIDPGLLGSRADVQALLRHDAKADGAHTNGHLLLNGWRHAFVGADLLRLLSGDQALRIDPQHGLPLPD